MIDLSKLTDTQKRGLAEAARIISHAEGIPLPSAMEAVQRAPGKLKALATTIAQVADVIDGAATQADDNED